jgi:transcriptional regulator with XRE-family HTH domain
VFQNRTSGDPELPKNIIGRRVREARLMRRPRITQADLSALLAAYDVRITRGGISKIESGERSVFDYEVKAIAEALAVKLSWLLDEQEL